MPKPTSTALHLNDNLSDDSVDPQYGDAAGQDQTARKANVTSVSAARPSRPAALNTADSKKKIASRAHDITVKFSENELDISDKCVAVSATVKLEHKNTGTGDNVKVRTSQGGTAKAVFKTGTNPYPAGTYELDSKITGDIKLEVEVTSLRSTPTSHHQDDYHCDSGANGTINVGN